MQSVIQFVLSRLHQLGIADVFGVAGDGELSAINTIGGAYTEHMPVFLLVGMPNEMIQRARALVHHTVGNGEYHLFYQMAAPVVRARAIITPFHVCGTSTGFRREH